MQVSKESHVEVLASLPSVKEVKIKAKAKWSIKDLKREICREFALEPEYTRLIVDEKFLDENGTIEELNLAGKSVTVDYLWARNFLLWAPEQQQKIRNSTVLIAGAGALGNEVAKNLAMLGVKRLVIVDFDVVEMSNVSRMFLFDIEDVGKPKAEVLGSRITEKYPFVEVYAYTCKLEQLPLENYLMSDVIVSGLDNIASRIFLAAIARKYQIPLVDGGTLGHQGRIQVYIPPDSPCPACNFPPEKYPELVNLKNPCDPKISENKIPTVTTVNSYVASIQAQETLKIILGYKEFQKTGRWPQNTGQPLQGVQIADLKFEKYTIMKLERNRKCIVCGEKGLAKPVRKLTLALNLTFRSTSELYNYLKQNIGKNVDLYTASDFPPKKIITGRDLRDYSLHKGGYIQGIANFYGSEREEIILKIEPAGNGKQN
ncbi:MAG: ThiF family adenylyltransferase [Fervidobacterium sp.]